MQEAREPGGRSLTRRTVSLARTVVNKNQSTSLRVGAAATLVGVPGASVYGAVHGISALAQAEPALAHAATQPLSLVGHTAGLALVLVGPLTIARFSAATPNRHSPPSPIDMAMRDKMRSVRNVSAIGMGASTLVAGGLELAQVAGASGLGGEIHLGGDMAVMAATVTLMAAGLTRLWGIGLPPTAARPRSIAE